MNDFLSSKHSPSTAILHYTASPVIGGVEAVIAAHTKVFARSGYPAAVVVGRGDKALLPAGVGFHKLSLMDSQHKAVLAINAQLEKGNIPSTFLPMVEEIEAQLTPILRTFDNVVLHNLFTKHFNLPLTAALYRLIDNGTIHHCIAWCHDFTWTSPNSRDKVHPGYPWDLLRTYREEITYVVVSKRRQQVLADLLGCDKEKIHVVYNGVEPHTLLGLSEEGADLIQRLELWPADLILLMPVRITQAKNIEYALEVVAALRNLGTDARLVITGPPDPHDEQSMAYFDSLRQLRQQLGLNDAVHFVFESGHDPHQPYTINAQVVGDLYRVSDLLFMPSHREGFGMPILEAGLAGIPIVCTNVPAAEEIGSEDVLLFSEALSPRELSQRITTWVEENSIYRLRCRVRKRYTWQAIFDQAIRPLLKDRGGHCD